MVVSFCAVFFSRDVLDEILDLIESVSGGFPTYSYNSLDILVGQICDIVFLII